MSPADIDTEHLRALITLVRDEGVEEFRYGDLHIRFAAVQVEPQDKREMDPELFVRRAAEENTARAPSEDVGLTPLQRQYAHLLNLGNR